MPFRIMHVSTVQRNLFQAHFCLFAVCKRLRFLLATFVLIYSFLECMFNPVVIFLDM